VRAVVLEKNELKT